MSANDRKAPITINCYLVKMKPLTCYWFTFTKTAKPSPLNIECGVDCIQL